MKKIMAMIYTQFVEKDDYFNRIAFYFSLVAGFLSRLIGGYDELAGVLVYLVIADFIVGFLAAVKMKKLDSSIMFWGGLRKIIMFVVVAVAYQLNRIMATFLSLRELTLYFYIGKEGLSFVENVGKLVELPPALSQFFKQLKEKGEAEGTDLKEGDDQDEKENR